MNAEWALYLCLGVTFRSNWRCGRCDLRLTCQLGWAESRANPATHSTHKTCDSAPNGATTTQPGATPQERNQRLRQAPTGRHKSMIEPRTRLQTSIVPPLSGLNHSKESPSQGVALSFRVDGPLGRITEGSGST